VAAAASVIRYIGEEGEGYIHITVGMNVGGFAEPWLPQPISPIAGEESQVKFLPDSEESSLKH
jgi:hypothetical protein